MLNVCFSIKCTTGYHSSVSISRHYRPIWLNEVQLLKFSEDVFRIYKKITSLLQSPAK